MFSNDTSIQNVAILYDIRVYRFIFYILIVVIVITIDKKKVIILHDIQKLIN